MSPARAVSTSIATRARCKTASTSISPGGSANTSSRSSALTTSCSTSSHSCKTSTSAGIWRCPPRARRAPIPWTSCATGLSSYVSGIPSTSRCAASRRWARPQGSPRPRETGTIPKCARPRRRSRKRSFSMRAAIPRSSPRTCDTCSSPTSGSAPSGSAFAC